MRKVCTICTVIKWGQIKTPSGLILPLIPGDSCVTCCLSIFPEILSVCFTKVWDCGMCALYENMSMIHRLPWTFFFFTYQYVLDLVPYSHTGIYLLFSMIFCLLIHSLNGYHDWCCWTRLEPKAKYFILVFSMSEGTCLGTGTQVFGPSSTVIPDTLSGNLGWKYSSLHMNGYPYGLLML